MQLIAIKIRIEAKIYASVGIDIYPNEVANILRKKISISIVEILNEFVNKRSKDRSDVFSEHVSVISRNVSFSSTMKFPLL